MGDGDVPWNVICEPHGNNPGFIKRALRSGETPENTGGIIVYLVNGSAKQEVSRVAYIRRARVCKNPSRTFKAQLQIEVDKAREAASKINELAAAGDGSLQ
jgi:hypothetical protein